MRVTVEFQVAGTTHEMISQKANELLANYLGLDNVEDLAENVDYEIHAVQEELDAKVLHAKVTARVRQ
jgi:hypothetical protein